MTPRRAAHRILAAVLVVSLLVPTGAWAATQAQLKSRLQELNKQSAAAGRRYSRAYWELDETEVKLGRTNRKLKKTRKELTAARKRLNKHARAIYRREDLDLLSFLVGARTFEDLVSRMDYLSRIGESDAEVVTDIERLNARLTEQRTELREERERRVKDAKKLRAERDRLNARLAKVDAEYKRVSAQLAASRAGGRLPAGVISAAGANGMVFPVAGSNYYADTWGASRSGGRRRHQGTDIMAKRGTPVVAVVSGSVRASYNSLGGRCLYVTGSGWMFYYAHLDRQIVRSGRVKAGQVIGTVGNTGNASGGAPHLHFQMHPGGGSPVNPYPYLRAMQ